MHSCSRHLDTGAMKGLIIELELESPTYVFKNVGSVASGYTLGNIQLHYDEINVSSAYKKNVFTEISRRYFYPLYYLYSLIRTRGR